jgi:Mn2+/Fe2+ NRAMP family transporter
MFGHSWHDTVDNRKFKRLLQFWVFAPAILAPFWSFPALLKVLLLAIVNALIIPLVMLTVIILVNRRQVMGSHVVRGWIKSVFIQNARSPQCARPWSAFVICWIKILNRWMARYFHSQEAVDCAGK